MHTTDKYKKILEEEVEKPKAVNSPASNNARSTPVNVNMDPNIMLHEIKSMIVQACEVGKKQNK